MKHLNIKIFGDVQGVNFRYSALMEARQLGIKGFARNEPDGTVYIEVEGEEEKLNKFLAWCRQGLRWARVEKVEFKHSDDLKNFKEFSIF